MRREGTSSTRSATRRIACARVRRRARCSSSGRGAFAFARRCHRGDRCGGLGARRARQRTRRLRNRSLLPRRGRGLLRFGGRRRFRRGCLRRSTFPGSGWCPFSGGGWSFGDRRLSGPCFGCGRRRFSCPHGSSGFDGSGGRRRLCRSARLGLGRFGARSGRGSCCRSGRLGRCCRRLCGIGCGRFGGGHFGGGRFGGGHFGAGGRLCRSGRFRGRSFCNRSGFGGRRRGSLCGGRSLGGRRLRRRCLGGGSLGGGSGGRLLRSGSVWSALRLHGRGRSIGFDLRCLAGRGLGRVARCGRCLG